IEKWQEVQKDSLGKLDALDHDGLCVCELESIAADFEKELQLKQHLAILLDTKTLPTAQMELIAALWKTQPYPVFFYRLASYSTSASSEAIGFIGLGQMGFHMAKHLQAKSAAPFVVFDMNSDAVARFKAESDSSVTAASSPADLASRAS
ncbi:hypothetical protein LPJ70_006635, partial [Coemansia sp. RSA 2708]